MVSRSRQAIKGFSTDVGGQLLLTLLNFIAAPIILRLTSQSLYGFWAIVISILGYLALTDLGIGISLSRLVAGQVDKDDSKALNGVISTAFFTFCFVGLLFFIIGMAISPFISTWFKIPDQEISLVLSAYRIAIFSGAVALPCSVFAAILIGYQRMATNNTINCLTSIAAVGLSVFLLFIKVGVIALPLSNLFAVIVTSSICYFHVKRAFPKLNISYSYITKTDFKKMLSYGGYFQIGRIANTVAVSTDSIIIGKYMNSASVTPYSFSSKLPIMFSINLASKLPNAVFPAMSQMYANGEYEKLKQTYRKLTYFSARLAIVASVFIWITNKQFVSLWVGPQYYGGNLLNAVFIYWVLQDTIYRGTAAIVYASGDLRHWSIACGVEAVLNIILSVLLVGPLGFVGVALGTALSKTLTTGWYIPVLVCRNLNLSIISLIYNSILLPLLRSIPAIGISIWLSSLLPLSLGWFWIGLVGVIVCFTNLVVFEGFMLCLPSELPWRNRLRNLISLKQGT